MENLTIPFVGFVLINLISLIVKGNCFEIKRFSAESKHNSLTQQK